MSCRWLLQMWVTLSPPVLGKEENWLLGDTGMCIEPCIPAKVWIALVLQYYPRKYYVLTSGYMFLSMHGFVCFILFPKMAEPILCFQLKICSMLPLASSFSFFPSSKTSELLTALTPMSHVTSEWPFAHMFWSSFSLFSLPVILSHAQY